MGMKRRLGPVVVVLAGALALGASIDAAPRKPVEGTAGAEEPMLTFLDRGSPLIDVPRLAIGIGGVMREAVVDTGSTGVVVSAAAIPGIDRLASLGPGVITYSSSGRIMKGRWVVTPIVVAGQTGRVVTRPMPILAVDSIDCMPNARRCIPERHPLHVAMLGIGFGREHDRQPGGTPDRNPLLQVAQPAGLPRSYVITRSGIGLGGSDAGFATVRLSWDAGHRDWSAPPACITIGHGEPACGTALVDTGITGMFLTVPPDRLPAGGDGRTLANGTALAIDLAPGSRGQGTHYILNAGDTRDGAAPSSITLAGIGKRPPFVNTGVRLLDRFDYLYDADAGLVGYRPVR